MTVTETISRYYNIGIANDKLIGTCRKCNKLCNIINHVCASKDPEENVKDFGIDTGKGDSESWFTIIDSSGKNTAFKMEEDFFDLFGI